MPVSGLEMTKKWFTPSEATKMLPLVKMIVADIVELVEILQDQFKRLEQPSEWEPQSGGVRSIRGYRKRER